MLSILDLTHEKEKEQDLSGKCTMAFTCNWYSLSHLQVNAATVWMFIRDVSEQGYNRYKQLSTVATCI